MTNAELTASLLDPDERINRHPIIAGTVFGDAVIAVCKALEQYDGSKRGRIHCDYCPMFQVPFIIAPAGNKVIMFDHTADCPVNVAKALLSYTDD